VLLRLAVRIGEGVELVHHSLRVTMVLRADGRRASGTKWVIEAKMTGYGPSLFRIPHQISLLPHLVPR
jgi:hypothetical protein